MRIRLRPALAILVLTATATSISNAAEWKIDPAVEARVGHNDNIRLDVDDELSSTEIILNPSTVFSYETPKSGISGDFDFKVRRYTDESDLDNEIGRLDVASYYGMERTQLGLNFGVIKDTTLDSQLEETGVVFFEQVDRLRLSVNPTWSYSLSERNSVQLGYTYTDVNYDNNSNSNFADFTTNGGQAVFSTIFHPRATANISVAYSKTENDADLESTYTSAQGGVDYRFSETLIASVSAGVRRSEVEATSNTFIPVLDENNNIIFVPVSSGVQDDDLGYTFSGSLTQEFERGTISVSASRGINSAVSGVPLEVTRLGMNNLYRFTEILSGELRLSYYESETPNVDGPSRDYYQIEPRVNWRLKEFWTLSGSYRYRKQTFDASNDDAVQNAAYLTLRYDWPRIAVSR